MNSLCTGIILAGGQNTRFSGTNKALVRVGGKRIFDRIYDVFCNLFQDNDPAQYLEWDLTIVADLFPFRSSLTGVHAGLFNITTPYAFFAACDTPFIKQNLIETILAGIAPHIDIVVPETSEGFQPLCAVYSRRCLEHATRQLEKQELKIDRIFKKLRVKKIPEKVLKKQDPDLLSFFNINTPEDLAEAEEILSRNPEE